MPELEVSLQDNSGRVYGALTSIEILDEEAYVIQEFGLVVGQPKRIQLAEGEYHVRATLPSGQVLGKMVELGHVSTVVTLETEQSAHEWLGWPTFATEIGPDWQFMTEGPHKRRRPTLWHRMWQRTFDRWELTTWPKSWVDRDGLFWKYRISNVDPNRLMILQLGGMNTAWRMVVLPPTDVVEFLIRPLAGDSIFERGASLTIESGDQEIEAVLRYLHSGNWHSARIAGSELISRAEEMLRGKMMNPFAAAVGGYFLIRTNAFSRMHDWPNNFANRIDWLPDGAVIHAWQLLSQGANGNLDLARTRLLQAVERGVPVITDGLRLLIDGLSIIHKRALKEKKHDGEVVAALEEVRGYTNAADWTQPFTTFYGIDPDTPSIESDTGIPQNWEHLEFLAEYRDPSFSGNYPPSRNQETWDPLFRNTFRLVQTEKKWEIEEKETQHLDLVQFDTKDLALKEARRIARQTLPSRLIVYRRDGSTQLLMKYD